MRTETGQRSPVRPGRPWWTMEAGRCHYHRLQLGLLHRAVAAAVAASVAFAAGRRVGRPTPSQRQLSSCRGPRSPQRLLCWLRSPHSQVWYRFQQREPRNHSLPSPAHHHGCQCCCRRRWRLLLTLRPSPEEALARARAILGQLAAQHYRQQPGRRSHRALSIRSPYRWQR